MGDTPKQPTTEAGREQDLTNAAFLLLAAYPDESPEARQWLIDRLLEVQAEAAAIAEEEYQRLDSMWSDKYDAQAAGLLALREALAELYAAQIEWNDPYADHNAANRLRRAAARANAVLGDTAPAAAEIEARIRADERTKAAEEYDRQYALAVIGWEWANKQAVNDWLASPEAEQRLAVILGAGDPDAPAGYVKEARRILAALREQPATERCDHLDGHGVHKGYAYQCLLPKGHAGWHNHDRRTIGREQPATEEATE